MCKNVNSDFVTFTGALRFHVSMYRPCTVPNTSHQQQRANARSKRAPLPTVSRSSSSADSYTNLGTASSVGHPTEGPTASADETHGDENADHEASAGTASRDAQPLRASYRGRLLHLAPLLKTPGCPEFRQFWQFRRSRRCAPGGAIQALAPGGGIQALAPGGGIQALAPGGAIQALAPGGGIQALAPGGGIQALAPGGAIQALAPGGAIQALEALPSQLGLTPWALDPSPTLEAAPVGAVGSLGSFHFGRSGRVQCGSIDRFEAEPSERVDDALAVVNRLVDRERSGLAGDAALEPFRGS